MQHEGASRAAIRGEDSIEALAVSRSIFWSGAMQNEQQTEVETKQYEEKKLLSRRGYMRGNGAFRKLHGGRCSCCRSGAACIN